MSRRARTRRDKRQPIPDFDEPTSPHSGFLLGEQLERIPKIPAARRTVSGPGHNRFPQNLASAFRPRIHHGLDIEAWPVAEIASEYRAAHSPNTTVAAAAY